MRYTGALVKKEREDIFRLFLNKQKLKFNEIEKGLKIRSNMVSYHLVKMQEQGLLEKKGDFYFLTLGAEKYLPMLEHVVGEEISPVPVVLVAVVRDAKILLLNRNKRPYKGYWGLIGGKMLLEESFVETSLRLVKEKSGLEGTFHSLNAVLHELVEAEGMVKHSFILFFCKVEAEGVLRESEHGRLQWFKLNGLKEIIPSDLWLIKNKLNAKADVKTALMRDECSRLSDLRIISP